MSRLPFDPDRLPDRAAAPGRGSRPDPGSAADARPMSVTELAGVIKRVLERGVESPVHVIGEVSNLSARGHWYFSLKDDVSVVSCVAWASTAGRFGFVPNDGDEVVATGHVSHYEPQGRTQLYVSRLRPVGAGALQRKYEEMCAELRGLGYFDPARKRPLPILPRRIAIVTSPDGAAIHDVVSTARQRLPAVGLLLVPVRVQGVGAADEVARAIRWVDRERSRLGVDALLVTRGGGSMEDLWTFNERVVADATYACSLPLVAAIGHESDTTVIELVADRRSATPTQATMDLVPDRVSLLRQVDHLHDRLSARIERRLGDARARVRRLGDHPVLRDPRGVITVARDRIERLARDLDHVTRARAERGQTRLATLRGRLAAASPLHRLVAARSRLGAIDHRLASSMSMRVRLAHGRAAALNGRLRAVDPRSILQRGFSYTTTRSGAVVRSVAAVRSGDVLRTHVADGTIDSVVGAAAARRRRAEEGAGADQMDLFGSGEQIAGMSKTTRRKRPDPERMRFEEVIEELEQIIARIEDGDIGLEEALVERRRAESLLRRSRAILDAAEEELEQATPTDEAEEEEDPDGTPG